MTLSLEIILAVATLVFSAGGAYYGIARLRRDCNGLGAKTGRMQDEASSRYLKICLALMVNEDSRENREKLADLLAE